MSNTKEGLQVRIVTFRENYYLSPTSRHGGIGDQMESYRLMIGQRTTHHENEDSNQSA